LAEATLVAGAVGAALELPTTAQVLSALTDTALVAFGAGACGFARVDDTTGELVWVASSGIGADRIVGVRMPLTAGLAGYAMSSGETLAIEDVRADPRFALDVAEAVGYVPGSLLAAPVAEGDRMLGVFEVLDRTQPAGAAALDLAGRFARAATGMMSIDSVVRDLGRTVLEAAAAAVTADAERPDVAAALRAAAARSAGPDAELVELAAGLAGLVRSGPRERALAAKLLADVNEYTASRRGRR
jgi:GAF domain-containing protein